MQSFTDTHVRFTNREIDRQFSDNPTVIQGGSRISDSERWVYLYATISGNWESTDRARALVAEIVPFFHQNRDFGYFHPQNVNIYIHIKNLNE